MSSSFFSRLTGYVQQGIAAVSHILHKPTAEQVLAKEEQGLDIQRQRDAKQNITPRDAYNVMPRNSAQEGPTRSEMNLRNARFFKLPNIKMKVKHPKALYQHFIEANLSMKNNSRSQAILAAEVYSIEHRDRSNDIFLINFDDDKYHTAKEYIKKIERTVSSINRKVSFINVETHRFQLHYHIALDSIYENELLPYNEPQNSSKSFKTVNLFAVYLEKEVVYTNSRSDNNEVPPTSLQRRHTKPAPELSLQEELLREAAMAIRMIPEVQKQLERSLVSEKEIISILEPLDIASTLINLCTADLIRPEDVRHRDNDNARNAFRQSFKSEFIGSEAYNDIISRETPYESAKTRFVNWSKTKQ